MREKEQITMGEQEANKTAQCLMPKAAPQKSDVVTRQQEPIVGRHKTANCMICVQWYKIANATTKLVQTRICEMQAFAGEDLKWCKMHADAREEDHKWHKMHAATREPELSVPKEPSGQQREQPDGQQSESKAARESKPNAVNELRVVDKLTDEPKPKTVNELRVVDKLSEELELHRKLHGQLRELHVQPREPKELEEEQDSEPKEPSGKLRE
eukprot:3317561-Ditylum_brightwellii.AAC.1